MIRSFHQRDIRRAIRALAPFLVIGVLVSACSEHIGKGWDWNRMRKQPKYVPYRSSAFFKDGKAMRTPPDGTEPAAPELVTPRGTPAQDTTNLLARGATQFHIVCATCHGDRGDGQSLVASNMQPPKPPSLLTPRIRAFSDTLLLTVITYGFGRMPPMASELSPSDRLAVVAYVRHLQRQATEGTPSVARTPAVRTPAAHTPATRTPATP